MSVQNHLPQQYFFFPLNWGRFMRYVIITLNGGFEKSKSPFLCIYINQ